MKGNYAPKGKVVVVKRFFGEGKFSLKEHCKEGRNAREHLPSKHYAIHRLLFKARGSNDGLRVLRC